MTAIVSPIEDEEEPNKDDTTSMIEEFDHNGDGVRSRTSSVQSF